LTISDCLSNVKSTADVSIHAWTTPVNQRTIEAERNFPTSHSDPELGQPFWSFLLLVGSPGVEVAEPKVQVNQKSDPPTQPKPIQKDPDSTFSQDEIRTRAYQIYEFGDRTNNSPDEDWSQAETELMELVRAK
jgi:Protein of unknown function (DUF2934)